MTEISDAELDEITWANSDQGQAAVRAAWEKTKEVALRRWQDQKPVGAGIDIDIADVSAIVYAAYLAAGWGAEPTEDAVHGCQHSWTILDAQEVPPIMAFITKPIPRTAVLTRCTTCGEPTARVLDGTWTRETFAADTCR